MVTFVSLSESHKSSDVFRFMFFISSSLLMALRISFFEIFRNLQGRRSVMESHS